MVSSNAIRHAIYAAIEEIARPGDVCFFITLDPKIYTQESWLEKKTRKWMGFARDDISIWHVGILSKFEKKPKSSMIRPYIIHSTKENGVFEQHITPEYFTSKNIADGEGVCRTVLEILRYTELTDEQDQGLVEFCREQIGCPFPKSLHGEYATYLLGLPNIFNSPHEFSCHSLVYAAFDHIGVNFPHHLEHAPFINIGRYLGHPLLQPAGRANIHFPYLRDHHIYQDARFKSVLTLTLDEGKEEILLQHNPPKYSWDPHLAVVYHVN